MIAPGPAAITAAPCATDEEAAAIVAAIERFTHDTAPPAPAGAGEALDPWTRAAMLEGVMREERRSVPHLWINP